MREPEWFTQWKYLSVALGAIAGYALAIWTEPAFQYPGLVYRMVWATSGMALGALIYWALSRQNSN